MTGVILGTTTDGNSVGSTTLTALFLTTSRSYAIGECDGDEVELEPKAFYLGLNSLSSIVSDVVSKEEIFGVVWRDVVVTDNALNACRDPNSQGRWMMIRAIHDSSKRLPKVG